MDSENVHSDVHKSLSYVMLGSVKKKKRWFEYFREESLGLLTHISALESPALFTFSPGLVMAERHDTT